jgi:hypothetical protein
MEENKEEDFYENQNALRFKTYVINMILLSIFLFIILYVIIDIIIDLQTVSKMRLRYRIK